MAATVGRILRVQINFNYFASSAYSTQQTLKPHVPLISFPVRGNPGSSPASASTSVPPVPTANVTKSAPSDSKSVGSTARGSGIELEELPLRYQRRIIPQDEMEYIEKGGPV